LIAPVLAALLCVLLGASAVVPGAARAAPPAAGIPPAVQVALEQAHVAAGNSAFVVVALDGGPLQLAHNDDAAMNPASTMKLLSTYVALATLGPNFRWRTQLLASRRPVGPRLDGDLIVRGSGDPALVIEQWWLLIERLRALGIKDIRGDLVLDRSSYAAAVEAGPTLDGNQLRPYNVAPDALLVNFKTLSLDFVPDRAAGVAHVIATPQLDGVSVPSHVPLADGACADWKGQLKADFSQSRAPTFGGSYARACGNKTWHVSLLTPNDYVLASFRALWKEAGGSFHGTVREGLAQDNAVPLVEHESPPLAEVIRHINKNSNNVMARQLFLTLGTDLAEPVGSNPGEPGSLWASEAVTSPASAERSIRAVHAWLDQQGLRMPELVLQNGSGLSREERISAASLARLLVHAWNSSQMPDFVASLPLAGVDGTMKRRPAASGSAYIKTGYLSEVRALAGYVFAASGHRYAVVALINDAHAEAAQAAHDEFLQWVWRQG